MIAKQTGVRSTRFSSLNDQGGKIGAEFRVILFDEFANIFNLKTRSSSEMLDLTIP